MRKQKKNSTSYKRKFLWFVVFLVVILILALTFNFYLFSKKPIYSREVQVSFRVSDTYGIIVNETKLDFGIIVPGGSVDKKIIMKNNYDFTVNVNVIINPELENFIYGEDSFYLKPSEEKIYTVSLVVPKDAVYANYSGALRFDFYPVK